MSILFVSRHAGAHAWAKRQGIDARVVPHLDVGTLEPGDVVIGTLPVHLAAEACARGARYVHLSLQVPPELRGVELSAEQMAALGAELVGFEVRCTGPWTPGTAPAERAD